MREDLHPLDHVPAEAESVVEVVDHAQGDERVVAQPGVANHEPGEDGDDGGEDGPGEAVLEGCR